MQSCSWLRQKQRMVSDARVVTMHCKQEHSTFSSRCLDAAREMQCPWKHSAVWLTLSSSGLPQRLEGAKGLVTWYPKLA